jgi:hypothetical protein
MTANGTVTRPTSEDFLADRNFCVVYVEASSTKLCARVIARQARITKDGARAHRINPYGIIENIELGKFQPQSTSTYSHSGVLIGYAEDESLLLREAGRHLEKMRTTFLERLSEHRKQFEAVIVSIDHC